ncbi:MAG: YbbR-like domain-containing protein [Aquaticitalea sp.]
MLSNLKSKFLKSIKSKKLNVFAFFLILSFSFLVITKLSKTYIETIPFHVGYKNVPEQYSISPKRDSIINVKVKAYGFNLLSHNFFKHEVTVDFDHDVKMYEKKYNWDTSLGSPKLNSQLGPSIEVLSVRPDSLTFPFEIMTVKSVPVKLETEITYASGYDLLDSLKLQPDSIKVIGPKNLVDKISRIKTKELKLKEVNGDIDSQVDLVLDEAFKTIKLSKKEIRVTATVEKFTEGSFEVPVSIINLPKDLKINYFPKTVLVSYYVSLENYKNIKALDFKIVCDYNDIKDLDRTYFTPKIIQKPELVKSARIKQNKVEFILIE